MTLVPPSSHTSGGIPGWSGGPDVAGGAGSLTFDDGSENTAVHAYGLAINSESTNEQYSVETGGGFFAIPAAGNTAYSAGDGAGGTAALDCGGLTILNLPTSDPGIAGGLYTTGGAVLVSTG